jgi:hypothetical protein
MASVNSGLLRAVSMSSILTRNLQCASDAHLAVNNAE